ncbi:MAG: endonuclease, partial [Schleiferiaceae bacterium]
QENLNSGGTTFAVLSTLLQWHQNDPVDAFETNRNNVIYNYQGNRNPFVDHPELAEHLYGSNTGVSWNPSSTGSSTGTACGDLFFSEYGEGSSNNKYLEIYNPTDSAISLAGYTVYLSGNGGSYTNTFTSTAVIDSNDVYVITNTSASATILAAADTAMPYPSVAHFNGDDAVILVNGSDTIDVIGVPGVDPGSE